MGPRWIIGPICGGIVLLIPANALSGERVCVEGDASLCVQPLDEGEPALYAGQLYTPQLALDHAEKIHGFDDRLQRELRLASDTCEIRLSLARRLRELDVEAGGAREKALQDALGGARAPWYEAPWLVATLTAIITTAAILGAIALSAELGQAVWHPATP